MTRVSCTCKILLKLYSIYLILYYAYYYIINYGIAFTADHGHILWDLTIGKFGGDDVRLSICLESLPLSRCTRAKQESTRTRRRCTPQLSDLSLRHIYHISRKWSRGAVKYGLRISVTEKMSWKGRVRGFWMQEGCYLRWQGRQLDRNVGFPAREATEKDRIL